MNIFCQIYRTNTVMFILTQLRPYVRHAGVPESHVKIIFVGWKYDRFVKTCLRRGR